MQPFRSYIMHFNLYSTALITVACLLNACSIGDTISPSAKTPLHQVQISAQNDANAGSATAVDIVLIYDHHLTALLPNNSQAWFANKSALLTNLGHGIKVVSLQIPPSTASTAIALPQDVSRAIRIVSYANYLASNAETIGNLSASKCVHIVLQQNSVTYAACA